jgi:hypothetical protein
MQFHNSGSTNIIISPHLWGKKETIRSSIVNDGEEHQSSRWFMHRIKFNDSLILIHSILYLRIGNEKGHTEKEKV